MTGPQAGRHNIGQRVFMPTRESNSAKRELVQVLSVTVNEGGGGAPSTSTTPDGRTRTIAATPGAASIAIQMRWQPESNPDHAWLANGSGSKQLEFAQDEIVVDEPSSAARITIAANGLVNFDSTTDGHAADGAQGDAIQAGGKDYPIIAVRPKSPATTVNDNLSLNDVYVPALSAQVASTAYKIVSPEATTGAVTGTVTAPIMAGYGTDNTGFREATVTFTPTDGLVAQQSPSSKRPTYAT